MAVRITEGTAHSRQNNPPQNQAIRAQSLRLVEKNLAEEVLVIGDGVAEIERRV